MTGAKQGFDARSGVVGISFSDDKGSIRQFFSSVSQQDAVSIFAACASAAESMTPPLVSQEQKADTGYISLHGDGGDNMETRVAVLEAEVAHIKSDVSDIKGDVKGITSEVSKISADMKVVLQKLVDIDEKLTTKAGKDYVSTKAGEIKIWMLGILLLSIAMPIIMFLLNLYFKKP